MEIITHQFVSCEECYHVRRMLQANFNQGAHDEISTHDGIAASCAIAFEIYEMWQACLFDFLPKCPDPLCFRFPICLRAGGDARERGKPQSVGQ